jgi:uncharacterized membrane protein YhdT
MTISFNCPRCNALIAFGSKHSGKRAHCQMCGQPFIIPSESGQQPQLIRIKAEKGRPVPGFYRAVFVDCWKLFTNRQNATSLVFVAAAVCFKFFLGNAFCCVNYLTYIVVWGWLLGFYLNVIYDTAFDLDRLPQIYLGNSMTFIWYIIQPFLVFFVTMVAVQLPFIAALIVLQSKGVTFTNMWDAHTGYHLLLQMLMLFGLFLFPIAVLTTAVGKDITLLRLDYLLISIRRLFLPYMVVVALLAAAAILETRTRQYTGAPVLLTCACLALNLLFQVVAIIAMRAIGLLYRHYSCLLPW